MPDVATNIAAFIFALGIIIFVHEAGHLLVAKAFGVRVLTFSLGFGKRLWGFQRGDTEYKVSLIPLGGYVRLSGEDPAESSGDPREFTSKPRWQRILVYLAGPAMNILFAIVVLAILFMVGVQVLALQDVPPVVGTVLEESAGAQADLRPGDRIVLVGGEPVERWEQVQFAIATSPEKPVELEIERADQRLEVVVVPTTVPKYEFGDAGIYPEVLPKVTQVMAGGPAERAGFQTGDELRAVDGRAIADGNDFVTMIEARADQATEVQVQRDGELMVLAVVPEDQGGVGRIGIGLGVLQRYGPLEALAASVRYNFGIVEQTFSVIGKILTGQLKAKSALSGPIEIAAVSGAAARTGLRNLFYMMCIISMSIAILNLLPIPVLDGGQIAILLIESVFRRDISLAVKERIAQVGLAFIVLLMLMVLYFDLVKNLPQGMLPGS